MATLVYSENCKFCADVIQYINDTPVLGRIVGFHDIRKGIPKGVTRVPSIVTSQGNIIIGGDIKGYLQQMIPPPEVECSGPRCRMSNLDFTDDSDDMFLFDEYGKSLKPNMTPDLEAKISRSVQDAYAEVKQK
jgi:hypothetical protein